MNSESVFHKTAEEIANILERKNSDYNSSYDKTRKEFGFNAFLIRISDKINRLKSLTNNKNTVVSVVDESLEDTIRDIAGYCILELILREKEKQNDEKITDHSTANKIVSSVHESLEKEHRTVVEDDKDKNSHSIEKSLALIVDQNSALENSLKEVKIKINSLMLHRKYTEENEEIAKKFATLIENYKELLNVVKRYLVVLKNCPNASVEDRDSVNRDLIETFNRLYLTFYLDSECEL